MNLIRNGGFERGTTEFWEHSGDGSFAVSDSGAKYGSYCGLLSLSPGNTATVIAKDYIPIRLGQLLFLNYYLKASAGGECTTKLYEYDGGLNLIKTTDSPCGAVPSSYKQYLDMLNPAPETEYVRIGMYFWSQEATNQIRIDAGYASLLNGTDALVYAVEIVSNLTRVASGDTSATPYLILGFDAYYAELECTTLAGTTPTLDVDICEVDQYGNEQVLGTFAQLSAAGSERIAITRPIGTGMYAKYTEGGSWTNCTFSISVIGVK